jgi:arylsulfatase A-like enzyme
MNSGTAYTLCLASSVFALGPVELSSAPALSKPNILFIMSDDHAAHAISAYGSRINQTPNIDRIASSGMLFTRCFVNNSICTPSRAAILTGKYSHKNGVTVFNRFDGTQPHLAKYLQRAGYQTAMVGKWHLFSDPTGFDYWNVLPGQGVYNDPVMIENGKTNQLKGYVSDLIADISIEWLKRRDPSRPFCLMSQPKAPHREWTPPAKLTNLFNGVEIPEPATFNDDYRGRSRALREATMRMQHLRKADLKRPLPRGLTAEQEKKWRYQRYMKDYLACVASMDENVGRILDYLEQSGLATNTIVIYTSDQGFFLGDHGWFDKRFMYEESLRMPLLIRWPGHVKAQTTNDAMVMNIDFAPTLLEAAGAPVPRDMQGRSFLAALEGKPLGNWRTSMYYRYYHYPGDHRVQPHYGVRTDRFKLIYFNRLEEWELYDLEKDPRELNNVYSERAYADTVKSLKVELARLRQELDDRDQFADELSNEAVFQEVPLDLVLHYDFERVAAGVVKDVSDKGHDGTLGAGEVTAGYKGKALKLDGRGGVTAGQAPDPSIKPLTVGAWCKPEAGDGVVIAQGGGSHGFSLSLKDGVPQFAVRSRGKLFVVAGKEKLPIGKWTHLAGVLNARAEIHLRVNGKDIGMTRAGAIAAKPADGLSVGDDTGSKVGGYGAATAWRGLLEDVRVYAGELDADSIEAWAGN